MAANRENQGLQIAVMIFFMLVVLLAVTTYWFFKNYDDQLKKVAQLEKDVAQANNLARADRDEIDAYKRMIGFTPEDNLETIKGQYEKDMGTYGSTFPEENRFYRPILESINRELVAVTQRESASVVREQELKGRLEVVEANKDKQIDKFKEGMDQIAQDVAGERSKFKSERDRITKGADQVAAQLTKMRTEMSSVAEKSQSKMKEMQVKVQRLTQLNQQKTEKINASNTQGFENPDGRITWVNQRSNVVWINLGQNDALKRQTNFAVYPVDANNLTLTEKKASIEVTRIIDQNMAEARILEDDLSNPILPGDKIHSPVWHPGRQDSFALVGFMDIDGDGRSDRDKVRDIILLNGGLIDMELTEDGKIIGELKLNTRYIVQGEAPTGGEKSPKLIDNFSRLVGQAHELGVETISVNKFIGQMGWHSDERTVQLGRGAQSSDFPAKPENGVHRRSYGNTSGAFQKRARPVTTF